MSRFSTYTGHHWVAGEIGGCDGPANGPRRNVSHGTYQSSIARPRTRLNSARLCVTSVNVSSARTTEHKQISSAGCAAMSLPNKGILATHVLNANVGIEQKHQSNSTALGSFP